ncbi:hypothetical protein L0156_29100 [bacterium]|nr:hypothetical protein [bacterium]
MRTHFLAIGCLALVLVCLGLFYGRPVIQNDGISYYALVVSLLEDHDFNLENQRAKYREVRVIPKPNSKVASYYSCGIAFLYAPFLYTMDLFPAIREARPYAQNVKFPFSHNLGIFLGSVFYSFLSIILAYYFLIHHQQLSPGRSLFLALSCFLGTPLLFYTFTVPSFTHASDTFLVTAAFLLAISKNKLQVGFIRFRNVLLGFFLAFSVLLRNNNIVIVPVMVLGVLYFERKEGWRQAIHTSLEIFGGALPVLIVHAFFNLSQYGKLIATGYVIDVQQRAQKRFFRFFWIFFHPVPGIYPWSPVALIASIGLVLAAIKKRSEALLAVAVAIVVIISIRFAAIIFPGSTFGQRLLTHLYIFWVFGLSEVFKRSRKLTIGLTAACLVWTFLLFNTYFILTGMRHSKIMAIKGGSSPHVWLQTAMESYQEAKTKGETTNPVEFWYRNLGAKPYPVILHLLRM